MARDYLDGDKYSKARQMLSSPSPSVTTLISSFPMGGR